MRYTLDFNILYVNLGVFFCCCCFKTEKWSIKYCSYCTSEARLSQYIVPFGNTEPTCRPLSGRFIDTEGRVLSVADGEIPTQSNL